MNTITPLKNTVQKYDWGSKTALPALLGESVPADRPWAELWMGTHYKGPSLAFYHGKWVCLSDLIDSWPEDVLGKEVASKFHNKMPYLFKVLAAETPLSIQAHPSLNQAGEGYERENRLNIALDAPGRNYKDVNHKPECICALEPFRALCGFRTISDMLPRLQVLCPETMRQPLTDLSREPDAEGLKRFFYELMTMDQSRKDQVIQEAVACASQMASEDCVSRWLIRLHDAYPSDIGILSPAFLNLVHLNPGEAMFLPAGRLHAYLKGVGIELMANSDNVLRGGLTSKHIDVPELMNVLEFKESDIQILHPSFIRHGERVYPTHADEFMLSVITVSDGKPYASGKHRSIEIVICIRGNAILCDDHANRVRLGKGSSAMIPSAVEDYRLEGDAVIYKAAVRI